MNWKYSKRICRDALIWVSTAISERNRWRKSKIRSISEPRVFYGIETLPTTKEFSSGGIVKVQDLQLQFGNSCRGPNLLYLVSSALPPYAPRMAKLARMAGAKVVLNQNGVAYPAWHGRGWECTNQYMKEVLEQAHYVLYQSDFCKRGADHFLGKREDCFEILYNPVDTNFFVPPKSSIPLDPIRLLLAGSHSHFYRVQCAVDTVAQLRSAGINVRLEIAGRYCWNIDEIHSKKEIMQYIEDKLLSEHVLLSGPYTQEDARLIFQRSHILLHTQYNDSCPRLVVEGMATGLPVVYSSSGGTPEIVGRKAGIGIPAPMDYENHHPPSSKELAEGIKKIIGSYDEFSDAARRRAVENFDTTPWLRRHKEIFSQLLKGTLHEL